MPSESGFDLVLFETERLCVREFNIDDGDAVFAYCGDPENVGFFENMPYSREETENLIHERLKQQLLTPRHLFELAVCLKSDGTLAGELMLRLDEERTQGELGYLFRRDLWRMGYASEAAEGMLGFGFTRLDLHRIYAKCDSENLASEGVMRRIGMRKEGESRSSRYVIWGGRRQWRGMKYYAILQKEYLNRLYERGNG